MSRLLDRILLGAALTGAGATLALSPASAAGERARSAASFVDSIGVNTHLGYTDTVYWKGYDDIIRPRLLELGVKHVRDRYEARLIPKYRELNQHGIRFLLSVNPATGPENIKPILSLVDGVEGMNEPDHGVGWEDKVRSAQHTLYQNMKGDPETARIPVIVSPMANTRDSPGKLGPLDNDLDYGNMHSYSGGKGPRSGGWGITLKSAIERERTVSGSKPIMVTETGYHNKIDEKGHPGVSELAAAKYLTRLFFVYFDEGIRRTYDYEFIDMRPDPGFTNKELHFGLLRNDGTPKPAYIALRNLISILKDSGGGSAGNLDYGISGGSNVAHMLLSKSDGSYYIAMWQEASSFDNQAMAETDNGTQSVQLSLPSGFSSADIYRPLQSNQAVAHFPDARRISVDVPDEPIIVKLTP